MAKRITGTAEEPVVFREEYGITPTSGSTAEKPSKVVEERDISSYPSPRSYSEEYLRSKQEAATLMPIYKEGIVKALQERQKGRLTDKQAKEIEDKIIVIQDGKADAILSSLSHTATGVTMDRVLRFIPELLFRENSRLRTLTEGTAYRAIVPQEDTQLSLFLENEEKAFSKGTAILRYSSREWAKLIYNKSNPLPKEEGFIERVIEQLSETKLYYPLGGGKYAYTPLIWRSNTGVIDTQDADGLNYEYIRLHPLFTLALTESKRGIVGDKEVVWHLPIKYIGTLLTKQVEYRLLEDLENRYSYAKGDIKAAAAKGEKVVGRANRESLLSIVYAGKEITLKKNPSRIRKDIAAAFAKMVQVGIIEEGTFKEDKSNYVWVWSPNYFKR
jgi:hypothetical protein